MTKSTIFAEKIFQIMPFITDSVHPQIIELLSPAKNLSTAIIAINSGADAVYMGASDFGARKMASNSIEDIERAVEFAHKFNARVYVTVNTIIYENELEKVRNLIWDLWRIGVDALIVQDLGLLEMDLPPIALHASTQCDIRTVDKARFLEKCGFSQLVLPRELSTREIKEFRDATSIPLEAFVHGALCVSYSGDCQASYVLTGRSANRGECAQICRYKFDLEDEIGNKLISGRYLLSLKDLNRLEYLENMLDAGITSFKIEGRLKDEAYVKNVVAAYSQALDAIICKSEGRFKRRARGSASVDFNPDVTKSFNRGFTSYFFNEALPDKDTLLSHTPKWIGQPVATVEKDMGERSLKVRLIKRLNNGDGLGYFNDMGEFCGFRLNRVEKNIIYSNAALKVSAGTILYRNFDKEWNDIIEMSKVKRRVKVDMYLRLCGETLILDAVDTDGISVSSSCEVSPLQVAKTPQEDGRLRTLKKLGDTIFELRNLIDYCGAFFIPLSVLTNLKRDAVSALEGAYNMRHPLDIRNINKNECQENSNRIRLSRHDNVSNSFAKRFYETKASAECRAEALEVDFTGINYDPRIMQTRYCLRRELGACLKTSGRALLPDKLFITSGKNRFRLEFDCSKCRMNVLLDR